MGDAYANLKDNFARFKNFSENLPPREDRNLDADPAEGYTLFIFRRDLRVVDNRGFMFALKKLRNVIPCFIFDPRQIEEDRNVVWNEHAIRFMVEALADLDVELRSYGSRLHFFYGEDNVTVIRRIMSYIPVKNICFNEDLSYFARMRDTQLQMAFGKIPFDELYLSVQQKKASDFWVNYYKSSALPCSVDHTAVSLAFFNEQAEILRKQRALKIAKSSASGLGLTELLSATGKTGKLGGSSSANAGGSTSASGGGGSYSGTRSGSSADGSEK